MSLSPFTRFLLDAAFTMVRSGGDHDLWLNLAVESHGPVVTEAEWNEVREMLRADFPDLIASKPRLARWVDAKWPHPTCECGHSWGD
jgi:hypothetical protein